MSSLAEAIRNRIVHRMMADRSRPEAIEKHVHWLARHDSRFQHQAGLCKAVADQTVQGQSQLRVSSVQMNACTVRSGKEYAELIYRLAARAACAGAAVVVFPEYSGLPLMGLIPGVQKGLNSERSLDETVSSIGGSDTQVLDVFRLLGPYAHNAYTAAFSAVARELGLYIVTGSMILLDETGGKQALRNMGHVFGPRGERVGRYQKLHLMPAEAGWGIEPGSTLATFKLGNIVAAAPICMDATYFESFRLARSAGADVVVVPVANDEDYNLWYALRGIWPRVQESQVFGISSCMVGSFAGFKFTGRSAILCPMELSPGGDGILAQASTHDKEEVVTASMNLAALYAFRAANPLRFNPSLYQQYAPHMYSSAQLARKAQAEARAAKAAGQAVHEEDGELQ